MYFRKYIYWFSDFYNNTLFQKFVFIVTQDLKLSFVYFANPVSTPFCLSIPRNGVDPNCVVACSIRALCRPSRSRSNRRHRVSSTNPSPPQFPTPMGRRRPLEPAATLRPTTATSRHRRRKTPQRSINPLKRCLGMPKLT